MKLPPPLRNSLGVISRPAINRITIPDTSPIWSTVSSIKPARSRTSKDRYLLNFELSKSVSEELASKIYQF